MDEDNVQCTIYGCIVHAVTVSQETFVLMRPVVGNGVSMVRMRMDEEFAVN